MVTPMFLMIVACANVLYEMIPEIGEITRADHCSKEEIVLNVRLESTKESAPQNSKVYKLRGFFYTSFWQDLDTV